jgi:ribonuclease HII
MTPAVDTRSARRKMDRLLTRERVLWESGLEHVAGVDEAGVGPLAGPVVAAAVVFPRGCGVLGVNDSKTIEPQRRESLAVEIRERALAFAVAVVEADEIDRVNVYQATLRAMARALFALSVAPQHVLVDARRIPGCDVPQEAIIKGDTLCHAIAAASILAKTARDALMRGYDAAYPGYGFAEHKGYSTDAHRDAIKRLGPCAIHRRSFTLLRPPTLWDSSS